MPIRPYDVFAEESGVGGKPVRQSGSAYCVKRIIRRATDSERSNSNEEPGTSSPIRIDDHEFSKERIAAPESLDSDSQVFLGESNRLGAIVFLE